MKVIRNFYTSEILEYTCILAITLIPFFIDKIWIIIPIGLIVIIQLIQLAKKNEFKKEFNQTFIEKQLKYIHKRCNFPNKADVRGTFHKVIWNKNFTQYVNYYPDNTGINRKKKRHKGIIGRSYQYKECFVENFIDDKAYRTQMVEKYSYESNDMKRISTDRKSYFACPVKDTQTNVYGVFFFDAKVYNTFEDENCELVKNLKSCLEMINDDIIDLFRKRY